MSMRALFVKAGVACLCVATVGSWCASSASAEAPSWAAQANFLPTVLVPGHTATLELTAVDVGGAGVSSAIVPVTLTDVLPKGVKATGIGFLTYAGELFSRGLVLCEPAAPATSFPASGVTCTWTNSSQPLESYESLNVEGYLEVESGASPGIVENEIKIFGGEGYLCHRAATPGTGNFQQANCSPGEEGVTNGEYEGEPSGLPAPAFSQRRPVTVGEGVTPFGVADYQFALEDEEGEFATQAAAHPYQLTTTVALNQGENAEHPPALVKDVTSNWPAGLVGNPTTIPQCTESLFDESNSSNNLHNECPSDTAIGVAILHFTLKNTQPGLTTVTSTVPLFNLIPAPGEPARAGFIFDKAPVTFDTAVRTGRDYGVVVSSHNISETQGLVFATIVLWGTPGDPSHDKARGWDCIDGGIDRTENAPPCAALGQSQPQPFLSMPTSCTGPLQSTAEVDSWQAPSEGPEPVTTDEPIEGLDGCDRVPFSPSTSVEPDVESASTATGLTVKVHVPQEGSVEANGLMDADLRDATVALPTGVTLNPATADGSGVCTEGMIGLKGIDTQTEVDEFTPALPVPLEPGVNFCPDSSKIATVSIKTPVLTGSLKGAMYLATQDANPFGSLLAMYLVAEEPKAGVLVKLAGEVTLNQETGQIESKFENTPQVPFEELEVHFFGGDRAPLSTPPLCKGILPGEGGYVTTASFTPWSGNNPVPASSEFDITSGPHGGPCRNPPFSPSLVAQSTNVQAGGFTPFTVTMSREDGEQQLQGIQLHMPPGLLGMLSAVPLCPEAQASTGTCGEASKIGETTVSVGLGESPYTVTGGKVYITGPYHGAPYGLVIEEPAKAGPFDLENTKAHHPACDCLMVRAKIEVNPLTAALTVTANSGGEEDAIPTILEGIPLQIKHVNVTIAREGFTFNPTDCNPLSIAGTLSSAEGAIFSPKPVPFQVTDCAALAFKPKFAASTKAHNTRTEGASLTTTVTYPSTPQGTEADIAKVKVSLPQRLPARLTTLQKACPEATFAANPANCPAAARIGQATTSTPVLPVPLSGPAYFVSHGGAKYPELVIVLQGDNVMIDLHGETAISKKGALISTFNAVPDAPFSTFELTLPEGRYSALTANGAHLCEFGALHMPTELTAQDGAVIKQDTKVKITGCPKTKNKQKGHGKGQRHKKK
jgi:hypothetical protein